MRFSHKGYSIDIDGGKIELLRKEYLLLKFLYENKGRAFSRGELLDAIWPLENPTDRTVDDHIYRLRKKLYPFQHTITIKTIKGLGYSLEVNEQAGMPTQVLDEIAKQVSQLLETYYKYGQGKALKEMITNEALWLSADEEHEIILLWLSSDFASLLKKLPETGHTFIALLLYGFVEADTEKVIRVHEKILKQNILSEKTRMDVTCFSLPLWYMKIGKPEISMQLVERELEGITDERHGFLPFLQIMKMTILIYQDEGKEVRNRLRTAKQLLTKYPLLREMGALKVLEGLLLIRQGKEKAGKQTIDEGIKVIHQSGHTYYFLLIYQVLELLLPKVGARVEMTESYNKEKANYYKHAALFELKPEIEKQVFSLI